MKLRPYGSIEICILLLLLLLLLVSSGQVVSWFDSDLSSQQFIKLYHCRRCRHVIMWLVQCWTLPFLRECKTYS